VYATYLLLKYFSLNRTAVISYLLQDINFTFGVRVVDVLMKKVIGLKLHVAVVAGFLWGNRSGARFRAASTFAWMLSFTMVCKC